jgi:hypothetical protein
MVNILYTEPDPEPDLDPDIRSYSQNNQSSQVNHRGPTTSTIDQSSLFESNPLSFTSEKPDPLTANTRDVPINEKDYATPGTASTGFGSLETTLNPSPIDRQDQTSIHSSNHPDDEDAEPAFPFISWKRSAIVRHDSLGFHLRYLVQ